MEKWGLGVSQGRGACRGRLQCPDPSPKHSMRSKPCPVPAKAPSLVAAVCIWLMPGLRQPTQAEAWGSDRSGQVQMPVL